LGKLFSGAWNKEANFNQFPTTKHSKSVLVYLSAKPNTSRIIISPVDLLFIAGVSKIAPKRNWNREKCFLNTIIPTLEERQSVRKRKRQDTRHVTSDSNFKETLAKMRRKDSDFEETVVKIRKKDSNFEQTPAKMRHKMGKETATKPVHKEKPRGAPSK
jgi:hypothetical protein